ncbi:hypothetical protein ABZV31_37940 [Streptomyces sp. NPDC005202]|uniref:hypothetical protein n=1 Tax=Streptomyces sp. NPDC005202 TaxID=3157021 RepID=UPI0033B77CFF
MGLLEVRETAARVRVEELRAEADRALAELEEAEAVLERRVVALAELTEALAMVSAPGRRWRCWELAPPAGLEAAPGTPPGGRGRRTSSSKVWISMVDGASA